MKKHISIIIISAIIFAAICPICSYAGEEITITSREIVEKLSKLESLFYGLEKRLDDFGKRLDDFGKRFDSFEKYVEKRIDGFEKYVEKRFDNFEKRLDDYKWIFGIMITAIFAVLGYIIKQHAATKNDIALIQKEISIMRKGIEALQNNQISTQPKIEITEENFESKKTAEEEIRIVKKDQIKLNEKIDQILQYLKLPDLNPSMQMA